MRTSNFLTPTGFFRPALFRDIDRFLDSWGDSSTVPEMGFDSPTSFNNAETWESDSAYYVSLDVPGIKKEDLNIEVNSGVLRVMAERKKEIREDRKGHEFSSRTYGSLQETFRLPENVDIEKIEAKHNEGVLEISIPKTASSQARAIPIKNA